MSAIRVAGLSKTYGGGLGRRVRALDGIDLEVEAGEAFGLLGPNGAGKTTLVKILLGLVHPTEGDAAMLGDPVGSPGIRTRVGYMPEQPRYPDFVSARRLLRFFARMSGVSRRGLDDRIRKILEEVDLAGHTGTRVGKMSKGMRQRLALAQALLTEPEILFLDEPTEGIDPVGRVKIREILRRRREAGTTLFINSHLLTEVEMICDQIAILVDGRVARAGTLESLTVVERQYRVTLSADRPEALEAALDGEVEAMAAEEASPGLHAWRLTVRDRRQLNHALDRIRGAGALVESVEPVRASLEEVFLQEIAAAVAAGEGDPGS